MHSSASVISCCHSLLLFFMCHFTDAPYSFALNLDPKNTNRIPSMHTTTMIRWTMLRCLSDYSKNWKKIGVRGQVGPIHNYMF